jgi:hypothetical protein
MQVSHGGGTSAEHFSQAPLNASWMTGKHKADCAAIRSAVGNFSFTRVHATCASEGSSAGSYFFKSQTRGGNWLGLVSTTPGHGNGNGMANSNGTAHAKICKTERDLFSCALRDPVFVINVAFLMALHASGFEMLPTDGENIVQKEKERENKSKTWKWNMQKHNFLTEYGDDGSVVWI